ncbi:ATP-binding cassette domain-containing protein [Craurococcus roseus]|uniref:ATP-binding cassette domain-containing protein n=1 Tax=Craurococcus roseus TaxID=77585 RepID=A0ABP3QME8_9PROT
MAPPLLLLQDARFSVGTTALLRDATLAVSPGERLALVGRNGSGKSTLLRIAAGSLAPEDGTRFLQPGATLRYLAQEPDFGGAKTALSYVEAGLGPGDDTHRARYLLEQLGLTGDEDPRRLSGGEARRVALAQALAPSPDILLLDEPTNHLDLPAISWLEAELAASRSALVLVSHDRRLLQTLSRAMVWLDRGATRRLDEGFASFEAWRDAVLEEEERERHKLGRQILREEDWLRYGVTARRKRNMRRVGELAALRQRRRDALRPQGGPRMAAAEASGSGTLVIEAQGVAKSLGGRTVVRDFSTRIMRGDRVGIVGPNGAGKTTLLSLLTGAMPPDSGAVRLGTGLSTVGLDQKRDSLDPAAGLAEVLTGGSGDTVFVNGVPRHVVGYMKDFLFSPDQARTAVGVLSGGERGRLMLARALATPSNLLVLDEPTNDLDLETLDLLEEVLSGYGGTVLVVSHDRDFLDRVATSVIVAEGGGRWQEYAGGYSDMVAQRGRGVETEPRAAPKAAGAAAAAVRPAARLPPAPTRKLRPRQMHALQSLPGRMKTLRDGIGKLQQALSDPGLYARDRARFDRFTAALAAQQAELDVAEEEWLALELLREEIESA